MMDLLVDALAAYRLTRLVVVDTFPPVQAAREAIKERFPARQWPNGHGGYHVEEHPAVELIQCPYCAGFWVAAAVVAARLLVPAAWAPLARALAMAAVAGKLVDVIDEDP